MENKSFDDGLTYFFNRRIHGSDAANDMIELVEHEDDWEGTESGIDEILRWADDGGQLLDLGDKLIAGPSPERAVKQAKQEAFGTNDSKSHGS